MSYQKFKVRKTETTYANLLEAYGLANLIRAIDANNRLNIKEENSYIHLSLEKPIKEETLQKLNYFQVVKFIRNKITTPLPKHVDENNHFDYPKQKGLRKTRRTEIDKAYKELKKDKEQLKNRLEEIRKKYEDNPDLRLDRQYDIYSQMITNPYSSFTKLYSNFLHNEKEFPLLIKTIFDKYCKPEFTYDLKKNKDLKLTHAVSQLQLFNPNKGNGLNKAKANSLGSSNIATEWITEILKISGALEDMICQLVKVGSSYDLKVYVPEFNDTSLSNKKNISATFKKYTKTIKGVSPVKLDIINILLLNKTFIETNEKYKGKIRNTVVGLHAVYQKNIGNNNAVTNIAFINTPQFIVINERVDGKKWLQIIKEQIELIKAIEERGDAIRGLLAYRDFLSGSNVTSYFNFLYWYAAYLMQALSKEQYYIYPLRPNTLNVLFECLDNYLTKYPNSMKLQEIIEDEGFQSIAAAIRKSTVILMYTPKDKRNFQVKYGLARHLQNKSKSNAELITFISDFIATFNTESARKAETNKGLRANVRKEELLKFYALVDKVNNPKMLGAMLAAYGFALNKKEEKPKAE